MLLSTPMPSEAMEAPLFFDASAKSLRFSGLRRSNLSSGEPKEAITPSRPRSPAQRSASGVPPLPAIIQSQTPILNRESGEARSKPGAAERSGATAAERPRAAEERR